MNEEIKRLFIESGCEIPFEEPPKNHFITQNPIKEKTEEELLFDINTLNQISGDFNEEITNEEKFWKIRQSYITEIRSKNRNEFITQRLEEIKNILKNGSIQDIENLFKERHKWVTAIHKTKKDGKNICSIQSCSNFSLPGTNYCINHITEDLNQKLYINCPQCGTIYPKISKCFYCND